MPMQIDEDKRKKLFSLVKEWHANGEKFDQTVTSLDQNPTRNNSWAYAISKNIGIGPRYIAAVISIVRYGILEIQQYVEDGYVNVHSAAIFISKFREKSLQKTILQTRGKLSIRQIILRNAKPHEQRILTNELPRRQRRRFNPAVISASLSLPEEDMAFQSMQAFYLSKSVSVQHQFKTWVNTYEREKDV